MKDFLFSAAEFKFSGDGATGEFTGYASVFNNADAHGDVIVPGAFQKGLDERKAAGRIVPMHVMHGVAGDGVPVGVWKNLSEDSNGLLAEGKISGMNTDAGRLLYERVKDGAFGGLSIGYRVPKDGATFGKKAGEAKRTLSAINLAEISLVDDPSNALARVNEIKAAAAAADTFSPNVTTAAIGVANAIKMHDNYMSDNYGYPSAKEKATMMRHLMNAHEALTGDAVPDGVQGWKKMPVSADDLEEFFKSKGLTAQAAAEFTASAFKSFLSSVPDEQVQHKSVARELDDALSAFSSFSLPTFK